jgi:hypothetical protein
LGDRKITRSIAIATRYSDRRRAEIERQRGARLEDLEWADGIALTTRRPPRQQDEAIERSALRSNQPGSRQ